MLWLSHRDLGSKGVVWSRTEGRVPTLTRGRGSCRSGPNGWLYRDSLLKTTGRNHGRDGKSRTDTPGSPVTGTNPGGKWGNILFYRSVQGLYFSSPCSDRHEWRDPPVPEVGNGGDGKILVFYTQRGTGLHWNPYGPTRGLHSPSTVSLTVPLRLRITPTEEYPSSSSFFSRYLGLGL